MNIVVDINHPAHVHFFKNFIRIIKSKGHEVLITASQKDVAMELMDNYNLEYVKLGSYGSSLIRKLVNIPLLDLRMYRATKNFKPDFFIGLGSVRAAHVSKMFHKPCVIFEDTEHSIEQIYLYAPFADVIFTPVSFKRELGKKQIRYNGFHELAYLHPRYFKPNPSVLDEMGLTEENHIFLLRIAAFNASHDTKSEKLTRECTMALINKLEKVGTIVITSEINLEPSLKKYQYNLQPDKYHDLLYYSKLYIGEGSTSAIEAAVLGVPSLHFERINDHGNIYGFDKVSGVIDELQNKYELIYSFFDEGALLNKVDELIPDLENIKMEWETKKLKLREDKIDVTKFIITLIEEFPNSLGHRF